MTFAWVDLIHTQSSQPYITRSFHRINRLNDRLRFFGVARLKHLHIRQGTHQRQIFNRLVRCAVFPNADAGMSSTDLYIQIRITDAVADLFKSSSCRKHRETGSINNLAARCQSCGNRHHVAFGNSKIKMSVWANLFCFNRLRRLGQIRIQNDNVFFFQHQLRQGFSISFPCRGCHSLSPPNSFIA